MNGYETLSRLTCGFLALVLAPQLWAAPGDVIFEETFENGSWNGDWTVSGLGEANRGTQTSEAGAYSLYLGEDTVSVTSRSGRVDLSGRGGELRFWIRRGSDAFSEDPDGGEDLVVSYLNSSGAWRTLVQYDGNGTPGQIYVYDQELPDDASHANFQIRFTQLDGSGNGWDYWHVDTVRVTESSWVPGDILYEEDYEDGSWLSDWQINGSGVAERGAQTSETGTHSFLLGERNVRATLRNGRVNLENQVARLRFWVRRGADSFSEDPDSGEDLRVQYRDDNGNWQTLIQYAGNGTPGEVFIFDQLLPDDALHSGFQLRFELLTGSGTGWDYWHVDNIRITGAATAVSVPVVSHDNSGSYCAEESISLRVLDGQGAVQTGFVGTVTVSTSSNLGSWRRISGQGALVDATLDDGQASYSFVAGDGGEAILGLTYSSGMSAVDVDMTIVSSGATDDDSEGLLSFLPQDFVVTASQLPNSATPPYVDPIGAQTAESTFRVHVTAVSGACGVTTDFSGPHQFDVWQNLLNPTSGTRRVIFDGNTVGAGAGLPERRTYTFNNGRAEITSSYADVGRLSLGFTEVATGSSVVSNEFVVRPAALMITNVETAGGDANPGATGLSGDIFAPAGTSLRLTVEARGASGTLLPNFGFESPAELPALTPQLLAPLGGANRMTNSDAFVRVAPGRFENTTFSFDEVGIISLQAGIADGNYLGTGNVTGNTVSPIGRFSVDRFSLLSSNVQAACATFTYMDHDALELDVEVEARNARNDRILNYDQILYGVTPLETVSIRAENNDDGSDLGARLTYAPPTWSQGRWLLNVTDASFSKLATPDGSYDQLELSVAVTETLEQAALTGRDRNPSTTGDCAISADCLSRSIGTTQIRFGRLAQMPVQGPEDKTLSMPIVAEYWDQGFRLNDEDSCTTYDTSVASLSDYSGDLNAGETVVTTPLNLFSLVNGVGVLGQRPTLSAPGFGNRGSVLVTNLAPDWLRYDWTGLGLTSPSARATFGQFRGHDRVLVWREVSR